MHGDCLGYLDSDESDESNEEESNGLVSESGSFGTCGACLGGFLCDVAFAVGVTPVGGDYPFDSGVGSLFLQCGTCTVDFVCTDEELLCARDVVKENLLACYFVEIVLARGSEVVLTSESKRYVCTEFSSGVLS